jgi:hypothetical protein
MQPKLPTTTTITSTSQIHSNHPTLGLSLLWHPCKRLLLMLLLLLHA